MSNKQKKKPLEDVLYELKIDVEREFFKAKPLKRFPDDFLPRKVKKELADIKNLPDLQLKLGSRFTSKSHRDMRKKVDFRKVMALCAEFKKTEAKMIYEIIVLPEGKFELKIEKKVQICPEKWPMPLEFDYFEAAKYVLYSRRVGQCVYNLPKDETIVKKAVAKYETYLKEVRDKLIKAFMERKTSKELAEGFAKLVFDEKLPFSYLAK